MKPPIVLYRMESRQAGERVKGSPFPRNNGTSKDIPSKELASLIRPIVQFEGDIIYNTDKRTVFHKNF